MEEAVEHISKHSTGHSEAIITESKEAADYFTMRVDSAAVYVNVSTRFTDGANLDSDARWESPPRNFMPEDQWA